MEEKCLDKYDVINFFIQFFKEKGIIVSINYEEKKYFKIDDSFEILLEIQCGIPSAEILSTGEMLAQLILRKLGHNRVNFVHENAYKNKIKEYLENSVKTIAELQTLHNEIDKQITDKLKKIKEISKK